MNERTSGAARTGAADQAESAVETMADDRDVPLFVDMDGVLIHADSTTEAAFALIRKTRPAPWRCPGG